MKDEPIDPVDGVQLLRSYLLHCRMVRRGLRLVERELHDRAERHDDSKLYADEFAGFSRINKAAREHPYGSEEYRAGLRQEKPTIALHYSRNSHHPEFHGQPGLNGLPRCSQCRSANLVADTDRILLVCASCGHKNTPAEADATRDGIMAERPPAARMTWLDLVEMVCDWRGAFLAYGSQGTWTENMALQKKRYAGWFTQEQWWLVEQVAEFVGGGVS